MLINREYINTKDWITEGVRDLNTFNTAYTDADSNVLSLGILSKFFIVYTVILISYWLFFIY